MRPDPINCSDTIIMEPFGSKHMADMIVLHGNQEAMARTHYGVESEDQARCTLEKYLQTWEQENWGIWVLKNALEDKVIGECGLRMHPDGMGAAIRFIILKPYRGQGLATICSQKMLEYTFRHTSLESVIGISKQDNLASVKVMEKIGMKRDRELIEDGKALWIFSCTSKEWLAGKRTY